MSDLPTPEPIAEAIRYLAKHGREPQRPGRQAAALRFHQLLAAHPDLLTPEQRHAHELRAALEAVVNGDGDVPAAFRYGAAVLERLRKTAGETGGGA